VTTSALPASDRRRWVALAVVCLAMLMNTLDGSVVNVALPAIQHELGFSQADLSWVVNAYLITFGSFLLLAGRLGDLVGRKRVFLTGVAIFTVASLFCGLANGQVYLIIARLVQGLGGAVSASVIIAMIVAEFPEPVARGKAMSAYIFVAVGGASIGLLVGGVLTQAVNWHWIFYINIPIGLATLVIGARLLTENEGLGFGEGVDWFGSVLVTAALMVAIFAIVSASTDGWTSTTTLVGGAVAIILLVAFGILESRIANPIMPPRIFRVRGLLASSIVRGLITTGLFSTFFLAAIFLERVRGFGATKTGLAFLPLSLGVGVLSAGITARLVTRFGARRVLLPGLVLLCAGLLLLGQVDAGTAYFPLIFVAFLVVGLGAGTAFMPLLQIAMAEVPPADAGLASGIVNVSMQISGAVGLAILATVSTRRTAVLVAQGHPGASALTSGYALAFWIGAASVAAGLAVAFGVLGRPARVAGS
jgi:EmrB/QacA subfamily drug resistance transporter